ncbi:MAG: glycoside hydrolase family 16 protein [Gemmatimonadales bacterium]
MTHRRAGITTVFGAAVIVGGLGACASGEPSGPTPGGEDRATISWELVWQDEFDGGQLDRESWTVEVMPDPHNEELQYYTDRADDTPGANVWLHDGMLVIEARREDYEHREYTSARIITKGKREFLYGRFEARMRLPAEVGMWPAFWMLGGNIDVVGWPACGEIDIMEGKGRLPSWTSGALHRGPDAASNRITTGDYVLPASDFHQEWHLFAVEWWPDQIRWYVDSVSFMAVARPASVDPAYWPFDGDQPFFLILNLAVGGLFDAPYLPPDNMDPQRLLVDYVRVYREAASSEN